MKQAEFYKLEVDALFDVLKDFDDQDFEQETQFKKWSINDVIGHLYLFDTAALLTLNNPSEFDNFYAPIKQALEKGSTFVEMQRPWLNGLHGRELLQRWKEHSGQVATSYAIANPKSRLRWAGPSMSARSSITARQMETWAHGHTVFDALGMMRDETDRIYSICHIGVATFDWTFSNRNLDIPTDPPRVLLRSPSGDNWSWNDQSKSGYVTGDAVEYAQVVTQVRNIADTSLQTDGEDATLWMQMAQCFAGPPVDPPIAGTRYVVER